MKPTKQIAAERRDLVESLGLDPNRSRRWTRKWINLKCSARAKGVDSLLTLKQYLKLAVRAGIKDPDEINRTGGFQMSRLTDTGDYSWGTCRFLLAQDNIDETVKNGGRAILISKKVGRTKANDTGRLMVSQKMSRHYKIISPDGTVFKGSNVKEFCKEHDLSHPCICAVLRNGGYWHGWTGKYLKQI